MSTPEDPAPIEPRRPGRAGRRSWHVAALASLNARGFRLLYLLDGLVLYAELWLVTGVLIWLRDDFNAVPNLDRYAWTYALIVVAHVAIFWAGGLYDRPPRLLARPILTRLVISVWFTSLLLGTVSLMLPQFPIPRSVLVVHALIAPLVLALNRWVTVRLRRRREGPARAVLVGSAETIALARTHLAPIADELVIADTVADVDDIVTVIERARARVLVLLDTESLDPLYEHHLDQLEAQDVATVRLVRPQDSLLGLARVGELGGMPFVSLSTHTMAPSQVRLKRWMDLAVLLVTAPLTVPLTLLTAAYVRIRVGRPVLFVQHRVGRDGQPFPMYKFRSMGLDAEARTGPVGAAVDDPRIVRGMGWIRASRLDELPQLVNVLRGHMTIVGPRPVRPAELADYEQRFPGYHRRHQCPPGITGLAQVYGHYHTHIEYKLGHDLYYLANWSPLLDLHIMVRTAWVILSRRL
ncbi:MAG TPA: sugar transferase [Candidatus Avipropionibacterium avicola]|uniref:Sugar transferase n=1 Tax=Candidatus Avipropionibacterium avicola TaxID=2840701 RepID=A0A9D1GWD3_9ACTN|nr:sugar transferase [Candidatus Avipropionibacterium avicola]